VDGVTKTVPEDVQVPTQCTPHPSANRLFSPLHTQLTCSVATTGILNSRAADTCIITSVQTGTLAPYPSTQNHPWTTRRLYQCLRDVHKIVEMRNDGPESLLDVADEE